MKASYADHALTRPVAFLRNTVGSAPESTVISPIRALLQNHRGSPAGPRASASRGRQHRQPDPSMADPHECHRFILNLGTSFGLRYAGGCAMRDGCESRNTVR